MTIRDVQNDFGFVPATLSTPAIPSVSIVGTAATYLAPNSIDSGPYGTALTELTANDTILSVGGMNYFVEAGIGRDMRLVVDWIQAPVGSGSIDVQLITSASSSLSSPVVMLDFTSLPLSAFFAGYRQITTLPRSSYWLRYLGLQVITTGPMTAGAYVAWLGLDVDSEVMGYVEGFTIK